MIERPAAERASSRAGAPMRAERFDSRGRGAQLPHCVECAQFVIKHLESLGSKVASIGPGVDATTPSHDDGANSLLLSYDSRQPPGTYHISNS